MSIWVWKGSGSRSSGYKPGAKAFDPNIINIKKKTAAIAAGGDVTMAQKNNDINSMTAEVLIGGKVFRLSGAEPEYLHKVAALVNRKIAEVKTSAGYKHLDDDYKALLLNLNIADEYFKAVDEAESFKAEMSDKENELYTVRHDLVSLKLKLENALRQGDILEKRVSEWKKKYEELAGEHEDEKI